MADEAHDETLDKILACLGEVDHWNHQECVLVAIEVFKVRDEVASLRAKVAAVEANMGQWSTCHGHLYKSDIREALEAK